MMTNTNTGQGCQVAPDGNSTSTLLLPQVSVLPLAISFDPDDWCFSCDEHVAEVGALDEDGRCDICLRHGDDDFDPGSLDDQELLR